MLKRMRVSPKSETIYQKSLSDRDILEMTRLVAFHDRTRHGRTKAAAKQQPDAAVLPPVGNRKPVEDDIWYCCAVDGG